MSDFQTQTTKDLTAEQESPPKRLDNDIMSPRILIVDDSPVNRRIVREYLKIFGECEEANNGRKGLDMFTAAHEGGTPYQLICLDLWMPEMGGHETLDLIRKWERDQQVEQPAKILIISALSDKQNVIRTQSKCEGYIVKPLRKEVLSEKLNFLGFTPLSQDAAPIPLNEEKLPVSRETWEALPVISRENGEIIIYQREKDDENADKAVSNDKMVDGEIATPRYERLSPENVSRFENVKAGEIFARLENAAIQLKIGEHILLVQDLSYLKCKKNGAIKIEDDRLYLQDTLVFEGDLSHQDVDFVGTVEIKGDVKDGVRIHAEERLKIKGNVGDCIIVCEGDVEIGRMYGKNRAKVVAGGNFISECLYDSEVECLKNVLVQTETVNSKIKCRGKILSVGTIRGGECVALKEIETNEAGSPKDVSTSLRVGEDYVVTDRIASLNVKKSELQQEIDGLKRMLGERPSLKQIEGLAQERKDKQLSMINKMASLVAEMERLEEALKDIQDHYSPSTKDVKIIALGALHKGVAVEIGERRELIDESREGPIVVEYDENNHALTIHPLEDKQA